MKEKKKKSKGRRILKSFMTTLLLVFVAFIYVFSSIAQNRIAPDDYKQTADSSQTTQHIKKLSDSERNYLLMYVKYAIDFYDVGKEAYTNMTESSSLLTEVIRYQDVYEDGAFQIKQKQLMDNTEYEVDIYQDVINLMVFMKNITDEAVFYGYGKESDFIKNYDSNEEKFVEMLENIINEMEYYD